MSTSSTAKNQQNSLSDLSNDQLDAITRLYEYDHTLLIAGMGAGKTVVALTAAQELILGKHLKRVLVLAPLKVCETIWAGECMDWEHLDKITVGCATGDPDNRQAVLWGKDPVVCINFENLAWLAASGHLKRFDGLIVDESTKLKGGGVGFKKMRRHIKDFKWRVCMSGTPLSENWQQIFYQMMLVDNGYSFGKNRDAFLRTYFYPTDYQQRNWTLITGAGDKLTAHIAPFIHAIPDYRHTLPPLTIRPVNVLLTKEARFAYNDMAGTFETEGVVANTRAEQIMKLQQISNGYLYADNGETIIDIHNEKFLEIERRKIRKMIVVYYFREDLKRLKLMYPDAVVLGESDSVSTVADWNAGRIDTLLLHPKSGGHGLNLASGGHRMIWIAPCWSRDLFDQTIARLWRRGQRAAVLVEVLTGAGTVDELINMRLDGKADIMPDFLDHLKNHQYQPKIISPER